MKHKMIFLVAGILFVAQLACGLLVPSNQPTPYVYIAQSTLTQPATVGVNPSSTQKSPSADVSNIMPVQDNPEVGVPTAEPTPVPLPPEPVIGKITMVLSSVETGPTNMLLSLVDGSRDFFNNDIVHVFNGGKATIDLGSGLAFSLFNDTIETTKVEASAQVGIYLIQGGLRGTNPEGSRTDVYLPNDAKVTILGTTYFIVYDPMKGMARVYNFDGTVQYSIADGAIQYLPPRSLVEFTNTQIINYYADLQFSVDDFDRFATDLKSPVQGLDELLKVSAPTVPAYTSAPPIQPDSATFTPTVPSAPTWTPTPTLDSFRLTKIAFVKTATMEANLLNGLVAYYPFSGNAKDASGNGNNGAAKGTTLAKDRKGFPNRAYNFDGKSGQIFISNDLTPSVTDTVTVTAWVQPEEQKYQDILIKGLARSYCLSLTKTGDIMFQVTVNSKGYYVQVNGYKKYEWIYIVGVYNGVSANLMVFDSSGKLIGKNSVTASGKIAQDKSGLLIGTNYPAATFNGAIDEIRIYNRALSWEEILAIYQK